MHRISYIILTILLFWSCSEPDLADPVTVDLNGQMNALLKGSDWNSGTENSASVNYLNNQIHVEGFLEDEGLIRSHITLIIETTSTGTFDAQNAKGVYYDVQTQNNFISDNNCSVDITELNLEDAYISGSFSFQAFSQKDRENIQVLDGEFTRVNLSIVE